MSKIGEAIRDISGWEQEADALGEQSKSEAERILHQAREDSREMLVAAEARCASERESLLKNADEEGLREAGKIDQEAKDALKRLGEMVSSRHAAAVDQVLKEMRVLYGGR